MSLFIWNIRKSINQSICDSSALTSEFVCWSWATCRRFSFTGSELHVGLFLTAVN